MKMGEEGCSTRWLALQPFKAVGVQQFRFRKGTESVHQLLKDGSILLKDGREEAISIGISYPGIDLVVGPQV